VDGWRDIWLNEGFATYMEARYDEAHDGRSTQQWLRSSYNQLSGDDAFWDVPIDNPGKGRIFSYPIYQRGGMALAALRRVIGTPDFTEVLRTWVSQHRFGNATTEQFTDLAEEVSGVDLDGFFDAWLRAGEPPAETAANGLD
jgi:aminopeptidase N